MCLQGMEVFGGIADWLVCVVGVSGLGLDGDVFLAVVFLFFICNISFQMAGNLNDMLFNWCLFSSE